jgi:hypothetical protein
MKQKKLNQILIPLIIILIAGTLIGCVPAAVVEWEILPLPNNRKMKLEIQQLNELLISIGYSRLEPAADAKAMPQTFFFVSSKSQRWNVAVWDLQDSISVKFSEGGEKTLSTLGKEEVEIIRIKFENEFGKSHIIKMKQS